MGVLSMLACLRIRDAGYYPHITVRGDDNLYQDGVVIDVPGGVVYIGKLHAIGVRCPVIFLRGDAVIIDELIMEDTWGDSIQTRRSNVHVKRMFSPMITPRLPYEAFHVDTIMQAFAVLEDGYTLDPRGVIENIDIDEIDITSTSTEVNGIMLSEFNHYRNFRIGTSKFHLTLGGDYWLNGNNLSNSLFGGHDVRLVNTQGEHLSVLLKDRVKQGVVSGRRSDGNILINIPEGNRDTIEGISTRFKLNPVEIPTDLPHNTEQVIIPEVIAEDSRRYKNYPDSLAKSLLRRIKQTVNQRM